MSTERQVGTSIFNIVGFEVTTQTRDAKTGLFRTQVHKHWYRDYHLLTPIWQSISMESLAALARFGESLVQPEVKGGN